MIEVFDEKDVRECLDEVEDSNIKHYAFSLLDWAIRKRKVRAVRIPDNATNGDVIKAMFPNATDYEYSDAFRLVSGHYIELDKLKVFDLAWWNAPYKG